MANAKRIVIGQMVLVPCGVCGCVWLAGVTFGGRTRQPQTFILECDCFVEILKQTSCLVCVSMQVVMFVLASIYDVSLIDQYAAILALCLVCSYVFETMLGKKYTTNSLSSRWNTAGRGPHLLKVRNTSRLKTRHSCRSNL